MMRIVQTGHLKGLEIHDNVTLLGRIGQKAGEAAELGAKGLSDNEIARRLTARPGVFWYGPGERMELDGRFTRQQLKALVEHMDACYQAYYQAARDDADKLEFPSLPPDPSATE